MMKQEATTKVKRDNNLLSKDRQIFHFGKKKHTVYTYPIIWLSVLAVGLVIGLLITRHIITQILLIILSCSGIFFGGYKMVFDVVHWKDWLILAGTCVLLLIVFLII